jgi:hypothetical protein
VGVLFCGFRFGFTSFGKSFLLLTYLDTMFGFEDKVASRLQVNATPVLVELSV